MTAHVWIAGLAVALLIASPARAEVVSSTPAGFVSRNVVGVAATPAAVYAAIVREVGRWWDPAHTFSGDARNLSIDARAGGCFCETLDGGGTVQHLTVAFAAPGQRLRMTGALGPLQELAVTGVLSWDLVARDGRTEITLTYTVGGYRQGGLQELAAPVDGVLAAQLRRLQNQIERGSPT